jgi:hypothetical protein
MEGRDEVCKGRKEAVRKSGNAIKKNWIFRQADKEVGIRRELLRIQVPDMYIWWRGQRTRRIDDAIGAVTVCGVVVVYSFWLGNPSAVMWYDMTRYDVAWYNDTQHLFASTANFKTITNNQSIKNKAQ